MVRGSLIIGCAVAVSFAAFVLLVFVAKHDLESVETDHQGPEFYVPPRVAPVREAHPRGYGGAWPIVALPPMPPATRDGARDEDDWYVSAGFTSEEREHVNIALTSHRFKVLAAFGDVSLSRDQVKTELRKQHDDVQQYLRTHLPPDKFDAWEAHSWDGVMDLAKAALAARRDGGTP